MSPRATWIATVGIMLTLAAVPALAEVTSNVVVPTDFVDFVTCGNGGAGEQVHITGDLHVILSTSVNGNHVSTKAHFQPDKLVAVGLVTGTVYQMHGVTQQRSEANLNNNQGQLDFVNNFRLITKGPEPNFQVHQVAHLVVNAAGFTVSFTTLNSFTCK